LKALSEIIRSGQFVLGKNVQSFEEESAKYLGVKYSLGVNSGTDALVISLRALGIGRGDKVVVPAFSFYATVEAVLLVGAEPIIVDINEDTFNIDPEAVRALNSNFKCIIPVHLFGQMAEVERLKFDGVFILEDAAQAFGASRFGKKGWKLGRYFRLQFLSNQELIRFGGWGINCNE
jgi:Predicted pyridoxal phosphate-dependent enzyme apparently involved in regulation of cell wall biogenesis